MSTHARLQELIEPIVVEHGLELFDLHFGGAALTVLVDRPRAVGEPRERTGVDMEAITSVTRAVSRALDEADPISAQYSLEVSSPGLERPLRTPAHFAGARGELVSLKMTSRYEGARRVRGTLERVGPGRGEEVPAPSPETGETGYAGEAGTVSVRLQEPPGEVVTVAYDDIEKARTVFEWHPEPKAERPARGAKARRAARGRAVEGAADAGAPGAPRDDEVPDEPGGDDGAADGRSATSVGPDAKINGDDEKVSANMNNPELMDALAALAADKGVTVDTLFSALADALETAYRRMPGAHEYAWVTIDPDSGEIRVMAQELDEDGEPQGDEFDVTPDDFGRIAAQTARQVMSQRIREAEREMKYEEYAGREGDIVTGIIQQSDSRYTLLDLGKVEALLPQAEQVPYERPEPSSRVKAYIVEVRKTAKGPQIVVSRTHPGLIKRLFELEVPEIADGVVEIKACAREPGHRTKIAVWSNDPNVDPVGACVGARGARVRMVVNELRGEKIDIVPFSEQPSDFVAKALSPAKVKEVRIDETYGAAEVIVPDYQLSLSIGKEGQNARLAARLTGWQVNIKSETQLAEEEAYGQQDWAEGEWVTNDAGEQVWQPAEGGDAMSVEQWNQAAEERAAGEPGGKGAGDAPANGPENGTVAPKPAESSGTPGGSQSSSPDNVEATAPASESDSAGPDPAADQDNEPALSEGGSDV